MCIAARPGNKSLPFTQTCWSIRICYTAISIKIVGKNVHATISKCNMGYDQYTVPDTVAVEPAFVTFLQHSQTPVHGLSCHSFRLLFKTTHNTFRDCRVHFFRQAFSKQLYISKEMYSKKESIQARINLIFNKNFPSSEKYRMINQAGYEFPLVKKIIVLVFPPFVCRDLPR